MNDASRWRLELAHKLAAVYAARAGVRAIAVAGSVARGTADDWSDLDLLVFWEGVDRPGLAEPALGTLGARRFAYFESPRGMGCVEQYLLGDLKVDVAHADRDEQLELVRSVHEQLDLDAGKQKSLAVCADAVPLYGERELAELQARLSQWPDALVRAVVASHLFFFPIWAVRDLSLGRGDLLGVYDYLLRGARSLIGVLAGLNRRYFAADAEQKGSLALLDSLAIAPPRARERIEAALACADDPAIVDFYTLIDETLDLVEGRLPDLDTSRARGVLGLALRACPAPPRLVRA